MSPIEVLYVTSSQFKRDENVAFVSEGRLADGSKVADTFRFNFQGLAVKEVLEVSLEAMVIAEVKAAYATLRVPCVVEHAGLIFDDYKAQGYPGGLTKPMWNTLADRFVDETRSAGRRVTARAVVAYCDGMNVRVFEGETTGKVADQPRGGRQFYWDTVFIPDVNNPDALTYAEMVEVPTLGLRHKMLEHSQSSKAMLKFLEWRQSNSPALWQIAH